LLIRDQTVVCFWLNGEDSFQFAPMVPP